MLPENWLLGRACSQERKDLRSAYGLVFLVIKILAQLGRIGIEAWIITSTSSARNVVVGADTRET